MDGALKDDSELDAARERASARWHTPNVVTGRATAIHLIENDGRIRALDVSADLYESGYWVIGDDVAGELTGGDIYFHKSQAAPSFFGGKILGFRKQEDGEYVGRVIFKLRADLAHKNVKTLGGGWGREKKIIRHSGR